MSDDRNEDQPGWGAPSEADSITWGTPAAAPPGAPPAPGGWFEPTSPAGPAVPPPQTAPGAPRRQRGKGWIVALVLVLGLIVAMAIAGTVLFITRTLPPYNGTQDFLSDVQHGNDDAAAGRLCSSESGDTGVVQDVRDKLGGNIKSISANAFGVDRSGASARVDFSVTYDNGRSSRSFSIPVVDENGTWKACP